MYCIIIINMIIVRSDISVHLLKMSKYEKCIEDRMGKESIYTPVSLYDLLDNMKQPAAIRVLQYWYTILVIPVFYQYLPVSAILVQILVNTSIPVSSRIFQYLQY